MPKKRNYSSSMMIPTISATIDLHGHRKSEAIIALTSFLDRVVSRHRKQSDDSAGKDVWVLVITGSGAHSSDGPVLRNAVEALLQKRQMQYVMNQGKGSLDVKANSGIVFYEPEAPRDTKLIIKNAPERIPSLPKPPKFPSASRVRLGEDCDDIPTPCEVAATDKALEESRKDQQEVFKDQKKEEKLLKRAVSMSMLHAQKEEEEEQEIMQRALSMSLLDSQSSVDDDLKRAMELSQKDLLEDYLNEDEELQRALELSQKISSRADDELLQILELSKKECKGNGSWTLGFAGDGGDGF